MRVGEMFKGDLADKCAYREKGPPSARAELNYKIDKQKCLLKNTNCVQDSQ